MAGEMVAFRRAGLGAPIANYARLIDRARVNKGGAANGNDTSADAATSLVGKNVTADAVAHTKGLYTEMIAATSVAAETITFGMYTALGTTGVDTSALLDIAFGADTAEVVKIANIPIGFLRAYAMFSIPFAVPAGTRIAFRIQCAVGGQVLSMGCDVRACGDHSPPPTVATTYNANTATSNVTTSATVPGATNTESAWTELVASTTVEHNRFLAVLTGPPASSHNAANALVDIGLGGAGVEVVIASNIAVLLASSEVFTPNFPVSAYAQPIPIGSRLSMRYQCTATSTAARPGAILIGLK